MERYAVRLTVFADAENASQAKVFVSNLFNAAAYKPIGSAGHMTARITSAKEIEAPKRTGYR